MLACSIISPPTKSRKEAEMTAGPSHASSIISILLNDIYCVSSHAFISQASAVVDLNTKQNVLYLKPDSIRGMWLFFPELSSVFLLCLKLMKHLEMWALKRSMIHLWQA